MARVKRPRVEAEQGNWADLHHDVLFFIFTKLGAIEILCRAQAVCRSWHQVSLDPLLWRCIDMRLKYTLSNNIDKAKIAQEAFNRCGGRLDKFYADSFVSDQLLTYIADRTSGLRTLVLISSYRVTAKGLAEFVRRCPLLVDLQIINFNAHEDLYGEVLRACPNLRNLRLNKKWYYNSGYLFDFWDYIFKFNTDQNAMEIANTMPDLRHLQMIGSDMTNKGLEAILSKCLNLESLDIRNCLSVNIDASLRAKLAKIKTVRLPCDTTKNYEFEYNEHNNDYSSDFFYVYQQLLF